MMMKEEGLKWALMWDLAMYRLTLRCHMDAEINLIDCFKMKSCPDMPRISRVELLTWLRE